MEKLQQKIYMGLIQNQKKDNVSTRLFIFYYKFQKLFLIKFLYIEV